MKLWRNDKLRRFGKILVGSAGVLILAWLILVLVVQPSNRRDWSPDQSRLATATVTGDRLRVSNVRHASYRSTVDYELRWENRQYSLSKLASVWFVVEPFSDWRGPAHTFLSFGFDDGQYLAISVEIRKERGESYSPWLGLLRQYELIYTIGDERDLIGLRAIHRRDQVYLYPIRTSQENRRALLLAMLARANALAEQPEFYNTLTSTCTSNIVDHIEQIAPGRVPFSLKTYLPGYADDLAFDLGLIDTALPREHYRDAYRVDDLAIAHGDAEGFSTSIRARIVLLAQGHIMPSAPAATL